MMRTFFQQQFSGKISRRSLVSGIIAVTLSVHSNSEAALKLSRHKIVLPDVGLCFGGVNNLVKVDRPLPKPLILSVKEKGKAGYNPVQLWRRDQVKGVWKNEHLTITVGRLDNPYPVELVEGQKQNYDITLELYDRWKDSVGKKFKGNGSDFHKWLQYFSGTTLKKKSRQIKGAKYSLVEYVSTSNKDTHKLFALQSSAHGKQLIVLSFKFSEAVSKSSEKILIEQLKSLQLFASNNDQTLDYVCGKESPVKQRKQTASELEVPESKSSSEESWVEGEITNHDGWWYVKSSAGLILSNVVKKEQMSEGKRNKEIAYGLLGRLEASQSVFKLLFPAENRKVDPCVIRLFNKRSEYWPFVGPDDMWTVGLWNPNLNEIVIAEVPQDERQSRRGENGDSENIWQTVTHHAFHHYMHSTLKSSVVAPWFSEGTAELLESMHFLNGGVFKIGIASQSQLCSSFRERILLKKINLRSLLKKDHYDFNNPDDIAANKQVAWGLMFYLYKGSISTKKNSYSKIPYKFFKARLSGKSDLDATRIAWKGINLKEFEKDFQAFWRDSTLVTRASATMIYDAHMKSRKRYKKITKK